MVKFLVTHIASAFITVWGALV